MGRRLTLVVLLALAAASPARAATCSFTSTAARGPAPLKVSYSAACDAATTVRWSFGDGAVADAPSTVHTFRAGAWKASADVTAPDGSITHYDLARVVAYRLALLAPRSARYGDIVTLRARVTPALPGGITIAGSRARRVGAGSYRIRTRLTRPGPYFARFAATRSAPAWVLLRPKLEVSVAGVPTVGADVRVVAQLVAAVGGRRPRTGRRPRDESHRHTA